MKDVNTEELLEKGARIHGGLVCERNNICSFALLYEDNDSSIFPLRGCHRDLKLFKKREPKPIACINKVQLTNKEEVDLNFYSYLFNDSPYADCFVTKDPSVCWDNGIILRTDVPYNLFFQANVATRMLWEGPIREWNALINLGFSKTEAFLFSHLVSSSSNKKFVLFVRGSHSCIEAHYWAPSAYINFLEHNYPNKEQETYRDKQSYGNSCTAWNSEYAILYPYRSSYDLCFNVRSIIGDTGQQYADIFGILEPSREEKQNLKLMKKRFDKEISKLLVEVKGKKAHA